MGGGLPKNYSDEGGGGMRKKSEIGGGVIQFSNYTPPDPTSPPYPVKNERSLKSQITSMMICSGRNGRNATMLFLLSK